ncbi:MAG: carboxypeptidase-like regulatory domain-containing protein [Thermoplasmatota archaeon]
MRLLVLFTAILLAGCATPAPEPAVGSDEPADGTGAISGLLIDDRFRPLAGALVKLNELQLETRTDENGEFGFTNLPPGDYTLNATAPGHETKTLQATVTAGETTQAQIPASRTFSTGGQVSVHQFTLFTECQANAVAVDVPCGSSSHELPLDFASEAPDHVIVEVEFSNGNPHRFWAEQNNHVGGFEESGQGGFILTHNATSSHDALQTTSTFDADQPFTLKWQPIGAGATPETSGVAVHLAVTADITVTLITGGLDPNTICNSC